LQFDVTGKARIDENTFSANAEQLDIVVERGELDTKLQIGSIDFAKDGMLLLRSLAGNINFANEEIGPLNLDINVPDFDFDQSSQAMALSSLSAQGDFQGRQVVVSGQAIQASLSQQTAFVDGLIVDFDGISASVSKLQATEFIDAPKFQAAIDVQPFDAQKLIESLGIDYQPEDSSSLSSVAFSSSVFGSLSAASLKDLKVTIDQSTLSGFLTVKDYANPNIEMDLLLDKINLDNYVPKSTDTEAIAAGDSADARGINALFTLMPLFEQFKANGQFKINDLIASGLQINDISVVANSDESSTEIKPSAKLYDGSFDGSVRYESLDNGGRLQFAKTNVESIDLEALLTDAQITDQLSGKGNLNIDVLVEQSANQQSSEGVIEIAVNDGAFKGVDIQKMLLSLEKAYSQYKGRDYEDSGAEEDETSFSSLTGTFNLKDNVLTNDDFDMKAPLFRIGGQGLVDLDKEEVDYTTNISVVNSYEGQGGESLETLDGVTLPVRFTGPMTSPKYTVDLKTLAKSLLQEKVNEEKEEYIQRKLGIEGGGTKSTKELLKSALNKKLTEELGGSDESEPVEDEALPEQEQPADDASTEEQEPEAEKTTDDLKEEAKEELKNQLLDKLFGN